MRKALLAIRSEFKLDLIVDFMVDMKVNCGLVFMVESLRNLIELISPN